MLVYCVDTSSLNARLFQQILYIQPAKALSRLEMVAMAADVLKLQQGKQVQFISYGTWNIDVHCCLI
jgi:hypothetical protein